MSDSISIQLAADGARPETWTAAPFASDVGPERELQLLLRDHPDIVPWKDLGLVSRLRVLQEEAVTVDGKIIDHLAVDNEGRIYIFECKIAKSYELRSVIAQALEYAAQLSSLTTLDEFLSTVRLTREAAVEAYGEQILQGLQRSILQADFRILIVTDYAGNSAQARVNRKTVEFLRSSTEIHLVEIAKFVNDRGERLFVPHISAGGGPVDRSWRKLEIWKRNAFLLLKNAPELHAPLLDYLSWVEDFNPEGTKVTPAGSLRSYFKGHYLAYIEMSEIGFLRLWVSQNPPETLTLERKTAWAETLQRFQGRLGTSSGSNYYLIDASTDPEIVRNHFDLQKRLAELIAD